MKLLSIAFLALFLNPTIIPWEKDFAQAKVNAAQSNKLILLSFTGSDWCGYCQDMHKYIIGNKSFLNYASQNLILVNADFPNKKRNKLPTIQANKNKALAAIYNPRGVFPVTVLLNANGQELKRW
jgi:thioredoxin-related protein